MVIVDESPDYLGWKIVRYMKNGEGKKEYLTARGWVEKADGKPVLFDDTMLWDDDDVRQLADILNAKLKYKK